MRYFDENQAKAILAEDWQIDLLKLNPSYCSWGPDEDYMWVKGEGWNSPLKFENWSEFKFKLDDWNECVNFYFRVTREEKVCSDCNGTGYHQEAYRIANSFYPHQCESIGLPAKDAWHDKITQDELEFLQSLGRIPKDATLDQVNKENRSPTGLFGTANLRHDCINRSALIEARCKRLGLTRNCETCDGDGVVYVADHATVSLVLWILHPRKGASRGIEVNNITQQDLPSVFEYLKEAAQRNANRFSKLI
jgi:hypothetical protein